jgi:hypothetical protein
VNGIALLSQRTLVPQQPIEWDIAAALSLKVEAKIHNVTFVWERPATEVHFFLSPNIPQHLSINGHHPQL